MAPVILGLNGFAQFRSDLLSRPRLLQMRGGCDHVMNHALAILPSVSAPRTVEGPCFLNTLKLPVQLSSFHIKYSAILGNWSLNLSSAEERCEVGDG